MSLPSIVANVLSAGRHGDVVDLRRDARGHGLEQVAEALLEGTDSDLLVDATDLERWGGRSSRLWTAGRATLEPAAAFGLGPSGRPAMTLVGTVLGVKGLRAGEGVSYGYTHRAASDTRIALVTGGYAQGIPRIVGNRVSVAIEGRRLPIIGRVAMDVCVVDLEDSDVRRGAEVVYFGDPAAGAPSLSDWTAASGLGAAELVTGVGLRVAREYDV
ncbi:alanine racemase [Microbacterium sp. 18062]|uniref:alanine racemase n=1 Tax=Microbacterium sp. 18062 TaxID=2681410 RepID=UPI001F23C46E|nr:alanine racemase C-terminal domain-containing protein [Microbacterium sp. 18062]